MTFHVRDEGMGGLGAPRMIQSWVPSLGTWVDTGHTNRGKKNIKKDRIRREGGRV